MFLVPHISEDGDKSNVTYQDDNDTIGELRAKHGNDGNVILTSNWEDFVDQHNLKEGDACAFEFHSKEGYLAVIVHQI
jgi:hypothetical protein